jgi:hypothetical protein
MNKVQDERKGEKKQRSEEKTTTEVITKMGGRAKQEKKQIIK